MATSPRDSPGYNGVAALQRIVAGATPSAVVFAMLLMVTWLWQQLMPVPIRRNAIVPEIVQVQLERVDAIPREVGVLTVGDSSGLMGVDATLLSRSLGSPVESLNTVKLVGPRGDAAFVQRFLQRDGQAQRLLIVMHTSSLTRDLRWKYFEDLVVSGEGALEMPQGAFKQIRTRLLSLAEPLLYAPLPGGFGDFYGDGRGFARFIREHHGTAIEPAAPLSDGKLHHVQEADPLLAVDPNRDGDSVNVVFVKTVPALARVAEQFGKENVRLVLMPSLEGPSKAETAQHHEALREELHRLLNLDPARALSLPSTLPMQWFGTQTHLNPAGREHFTGLLADALAADRARFPWTTSAQPMRPAAVTHDNSGKGGF